MIRLDPTRCKHCKKPRSKHLATTGQCPFGRSRNFPSFGKQTFEAVQSAAPPTPEKERSA